MRTFTEEEVEYMIVEAFDKGALNGVSWGKMDELPHLLERRHVALTDCTKILNKAIRNQGDKG